jgi:hypothetical protein
MIGSYDIIDERLNLIKLTEFNIWHKEMKIKATSCDISFP